MKKIFNELGLWVVRQVKNFVTFITIALLLFGAFAAVMTFEFICWLIK